ncbi:Crp/Fnr family transcriptional regulator [Methylopila jiangsuensis]|uniref:Crp/Fnr family transcriptional regulator n=1 Tax=Methylopila jiangsuensis TaxID=586230 RepID=A0A9W6JHW1_9HYPH|nr:Crp/Fnr family transcriptional regulator [Methylopila jiangsuensis]MDR6287032.1 CRP/FNR family transcriptional regulator [Methylopila jiangsuensis]GLK76518.1 Crp/Fnr family transcriptional regulator [Methylopila jiangsuensis]
MDRWESTFPVLREMAADDLSFARANVQFPTLEAEAIAYEFEADCPNYLMCLDGRTRVFRRSEQGREVLIYKVTSGGTCVLTTQCLLSGGNFPAESVAEARTELAAIPASVFSELMGRSAPFRTFVLQDYSRLLSGMFSIVDEVSFATLEQKLARRLLVDADDAGFVTKTHQQLASDVNSVREVVSRHLGEWERAGWVANHRGRVEIRNRKALASLKMA